jgi:protein-disulfide isomerase
MNTNDTNKYFLPVAVVVAGLLIAGAVVWNGSNPSTGPTGSQQAGLEVNIKDVKTDGDPFIGSANASVTVAVWSDFQCPFCKRFETETLPLIAKDYVQEGKVKVVFLDFAFLGTDSTTAGEYSRAVWKLYPEKYGEWREAMYNAQDEENGGFGNAASIDKLNATISGIDADKVKDDVKANKDAYQTMMNADKSEAQKVGIGATPSFVIGTEVIQGAYPYQTFQAAIEAVLQ